MLASLETAPSVVTIMREFPTSASSFINSFHEATIDDIATTRRSRVETLGPSLLSFTFPPDQESIAQHSDPAHDYFQLMQLSDEMYVSASYFAANAAYHHIADLRSIIGLVVGPSFFATTPAGDMVSTEEDCTAYLFSVPSNEKQEFKNNVQVDRKGICIYFDREQIEPALGVSIESMPESLKRFCHDSASSCMIMPFTLPYSATVVANDLLSSPAEGAFRYRQISTAANYLLLQMLQALSNLDAVVDPYEDRLARARRLLTEDFQSRYTLETLAREVGMGRTKLAAEFRKKYGVTATELRREAKLSEALRLIRQTTKSLALISDELGFSSQNNFSSAFKTRFQVTPRDARQQWIEDDRGLSRSNDLKT